MSAAFKVRECRKFVDFPQSGGVLDPFEPLFTLPHDGLIHVCVLLFVLHVVVLVLIVQQRDLNDGGDVLLGAVLHFGDGVAALGRSVRLFGWKNPPVAKVRGGATLLLLSDHLLFEIPFLDDKDGFGREAEGELDLPLPLLSAVEVPGGVHGAGAPDSLGRVLRFRYRQPGALFLRLLAGTRLLSGAFTLLLRGLSPQIP